MAVIRYQIFAQNFGCTHRFLDVKAILNSRNRMLIRCLWPLQISQLKIPTAVFYPPVSHWVACLFLACLFSACLFSACLCPVFSWEATQQGVYKHLQHQSKHNISPNMHQLFCHIMHWKRMIEHMRLLSGWWFAVMNWLTSLFSASFFPADHFAAHVYPEVVITTAK